jgi:hypothetical protein
VLPVASLVRVMMKASSDEALCLLVEMVRDTVEGRDDGTALKVDKCCILCGGSTTHCQEDQRCSRGLLEEEGGFDLLTQCS